MERLLSLGLAALVTFPLLAKVKVGENIVYNNAFAVDQESVPSYWQLEDGGVADVNFFVLREGRRSFVRFRNEGKPTETTFKQVDLRISPEGRYRISCLVRGRGFKAARASLLLINAGWTDAKGVELTPSDGAWKELSGEFDGFASAGLYRALVYLKGYKGELDVTDFRVVPLDEAAALGAAPPAETEIFVRPRFIPWSPRLHRISASDRRMEFRFFGRLPEGRKATDFEAWLELDGRTAKAPFSTEKPVPFTLPGTAREGVLKARVVPVGGGEALVSGDYRFTVVEPLKGDTSKHRRLNNLVTEVCNGTTWGTNTSSRYGFFLPRDSWIWARYSSVDKQDFFARIDDGEIVHAAALREGCFRRLSGGEHVLRLSPCPVGRLEIRMVPAIIEYLPCRPNMVESNPKYDWPYFRRHILPYSNVQNAGEIPAKNYALFRAGGGMWVANLMTKLVNSREQVARNLEGSLGFTDPRYDGVTCDELYMSVPVPMDIFTEGLKLFSARDTRRKDIYSWIVGKPRNPGLDEEFVSAAVNASQGRGKALVEVYCLTQPTEKEARDYIEDYVAGTAAAYDAIYPEATEDMGIVFGNFNQLTRLSVWHHPEVDAKVFLDLVVNRLANDPRCSRIAFTGYWGTHDADDEFCRWSFQLMKHYCIEGRREMLSDRYGFTYAPGHLANGDFRTSLEGWKTRGTVTLDRFPRLGKHYEARWCAPDGLGDGYAKLTRGKGPASALEQVARGLKSGRKYVLQFVAFDVGDFKAGRFAPKRIPLGVSLERATVDEKLSWSDARSNMAWNEKPEPRVNLRHVVFTPGSSSMKVTIDDSALPEGAETGVNCIGLWPYFEDRDGI